MGAITALALTGLVVGPFLVWLTWQPPHDDRVDKPLFMTGAMMTVISALTLGWML